MIGADECTLKFGPVRGDDEAAETAETERATKTKREKKPRTKNASPTAAAGENDRVGRLRDSIFGTRSDDELLKRSLDADSSVTGVPYYDGGGRVGAETCQKRRDPAAAAADPSK